ncbi:toxin-antitoxin system YwqK family antitoxin [Ekhidna sp.]|uniref:toxin-antitoxin system YwqK family antitoxin n=1 Tax=Ekhidna sp. TaxID=2608089 RepID=UPI0035146AA8
MNKIILLISICILFSCDSSTEVRKYWNNGELKLIGREKDGKRIGKWIKYTANNDTMEIQYYEDGVLVTLDEYAHVGDSATKATLTQRSNFLNSNLHGTHLLFHPNGQIDRKGQFLNGQKVDTFFHYRNNGFMHQFTVYVDDSVTTQYQYWPNGELFMRAENFMNGLHYFYDSLGTTEFVVRITSDEQSYSMDTLEINTR